MYVSTISTDLLFETTMCKFLESSSTHGKRGKVIKLPSVLYFERSKVFIKNFLSLNSSFALLKHFQQISFNRFAVTGQK